MKQAVITERTSKNKTDVLAAYKRVRDEFINRKLPAATPAAGFAAKADFLIMEEKFKAFQKKELKFGAKPDQIKKTFDSFTAEAKQLNEDYQKIWEYKDATWTLASFLRSGDVYYEFAQKLIKAGDNPPEDVKKLAKMACKANPDDCGVVEGQYKDAIFQFVTPVEDEAKRRWKDTLARAAQMGVTNEYVKKARENLSKYLPDEFPFVKDERIGSGVPVMTAPSMRPDDRGSSRRRAGGPVRARRRRLARRQPPPPSSRRRRPSRPSSSIGLPATQTPSPPPRPR